MTLNKCGPAPDQREPAAPCVTEDRLPNPALPPWSFWGVRCCWGCLPRVLPLSPGDAGSDRLNLLVAETLHGVVIYKRERRLHSGERQRQHWPRGWPRRHQGRTGTGAPPTPRTGRHTPPGHLPPPVSPCGRSKTNAGAGMLLKTPVDSETDSYQKKHCVSQGQGRRSRCRKSRGLD